MNVNGSVVVQRGSMRHPVLATLGAFAFANTLMWGRATQRAGAGVTAMLSVRFAITAAVMLVVLAGLRRPLLPAPGERVRVVLLGVIAYGVESIFFFLAIQHGSTSIIVVLFYTHVVIVAVCEVVLGALRASMRIAAAVGFAVGGTAIVAFGSSGDAQLAALGLAYVAGSVACYTGYVLLSARLVRRTEPLTSAAWVALGASLGVSAWGAVRGDFGALPGDALAPIAAMAAATAAAFTLWFVVVGPLGSARTAIIMMLEAPFGIALTALAFDDPVNAQILVGGLLVLAGATLAALETPTEIEALEAATSP